MNVAVIGLGLIGGSMARDLRAAGVASHVVGVDLNPVHRERALALGLVDAVAGLEEAAASADVLLVCIPVNAIESQLPHIMDLAEKAVVIDTGSTKSQICRAVREHPARERFVAAHPIAGTENSGPDAAIAGLFAGKVNIICERERSGGKAMEVARLVFDTLKMKTTFMDPDEHDKHVAYVSHLSHVSSFLLGQTVLDIEKDEKNIFTLAGSGFASTVRLAKSSPDMWAPIFEQNAGFLTRALEEYIGHLKRFHQCLVNRETTQMHDILSRANEIRRVLSGIELNQTKTNSQPANIEAEHKP
ncbi:MAG: prephenate dehydrogenase [Cyclobacteriaceae bacterium]|jgi:prephenate dehydrogenase|nr:prephenate dehydrogenase [Cyclobacteriaceae bacterium]